MAEERDLGALAREIIDSNLFMTLATADAEGRPWATPVYFTPPEYREFFWMSEPGSRHSQNVAARPEVGIAIFNSQVLPGGARAVYVEAEAIELTDKSEYERGVEIYNSRFPDPEKYNLRRFGPEEMWPPAPFRSTGRGRLRTTRSTPRGIPTGARATIALPSSSSRYSTVSVPSMPWSAWVPIAQ